MRYLAFSGVMALAACGAATGSAPPVPTVNARSADEQAIRAAFDGYRSAILSHRGADAAALVTDDIFTYMDAMRQEALTASADHVKRKTPLDRIMILSFRARISLRDLQSMTSRDLFAQTVDLGMNGDGSRGLEVGDILVDGDSARVGLRKDGQVIPPEMGFRFARVDGAWRLDVMSATRLATAAIPGILADIDPDPDVAIVRVLEITTGRPVPDTIWDPLVE